MTQRVNLTTLRVELTRRGLTQVGLAELLRIPPTTLSGYLLGRHPTPKDLAEQLDAAKRE